MKRLTAALTTAIFLFIAPGASAHTPLFLQVIEPSPGQIVGTEAVRVSVKAKKIKGQTGSTLFQVKIDDLWFDPQSERLTSREPSFGGTRLSTDQTVQLEVGPLEPGDHTLLVMYKPDDDAEQQVIEVPFEVSKDASHAADRGGRFFFFIVTAMALVLLAIQLSWRRRMSRS